MTVEAQQVALDTLRKRLARKRREAVLVEEICQLKDRIADALNREAATARRVDPRLPGFRRHDEAWRWAEAVDAERQDVWSPFGKCWR